MQQGQRLGSVLAHWSGLVNEALACVLWLIQRLVWVGLSASEIGSYHVPGRNRKRFGIGKGTPGLSGVAPPAYF